MALITKSLPGDTVCYDPQNFSPAAGIYSVIKLVIHNGLNYQIASR